MDFSIINSGQTPAETSQALLLNLWLHYRNQQGLPVQLFFEVLAIVGALLFAWWLARRLQPRLGQDQSRWRFGSEGASRVLFPLLALLSLQLSVLLLKQMGSVYGLRLASALLMAMILIRASMYLLQHVFSSADWLRRSERWLAALVWAGFALHITGILPQAVDLLDQTSFMLGKNRISLLLIINGALSVTLTMLLALWLSTEIERRVMALAALDLSLRVVISKIARTLLVIVAVLIALPLVGIDLTVLSVFGGAVGVGLGFGLQKIASNYVSGFIILLDRSIRLGDIVQIEGRTGTINKLTARYMVLKGADGTEAIIPNETLITTTVVNQSYNDKNLRFSLPVQVAYGSDLDQVIQVLLRLVAGHARILQDPKPAVLIKAFAESGIDVELAVWIGDPEQGVTGLRSELNLGIWRTFKETGIEIPYPRRDIQIMNWPAPATQTSL